jgi:hypothetical protein
VRFEVLTVALKKILVFWDMKMGILLERLLLLLLPL